MGRRGGKSRAFSVLGAYLAGLRRLQRHPGPGRADQAPDHGPDHASRPRKVFSYVLRRLRGTRPRLRDMVDEDPTADTIRLRAGVDIEVRPANYRTIRGETLAARLADEVAFWHLENSANPDTLILDAMRPGLATTGGPLCVLSSPMPGRASCIAPTSGISAERRSGGTGAAGAVADHEPEPGPGGGEARLQARPSAASAEYGAEFRRDVEAFITLEAVQACMDGGCPGARAGPRAPATWPSCDPSGGGADSMTLAIAHPEGGHAFLDAVREERPAPRPRGGGAVRRHSEDLRRPKVTGDRYAGEWAAGAVPPSTASPMRSRTKQDRHLRGFLPILNTQRVRLIDVPKLESQLVSLERRTTRGTGRDIIDHPQVKGAHDDVANAAAGAVVLVKTGPKPLIISKELAAWAKQPRGTYAGDHSGGAIGRGLFTTRRGF